MPSLYNVHSSLGYYLWDGDFSPSRDEAAELTKEEAENVAGFLNTTIRGTANIRVVPVSVSGYN